MFWNVTISFFFLQINKTAAAATVQQELFHFCAHAS